MKKQVTKIRNTRRINHLILVIIISATLLSSCKSGDNRLIPVRNLVDVLTEVYVAGGILAFPNMRNRFSSKDSITNYMDIIQRHGFTKARMDNTIRYYFERNPKKLENIYDQVLTRLNEKQTLLEKETPKEMQPNLNLWPGKNNIATPESGVKDPVWFSIPVKDTGNYVLEFSTIIYSDDQSSNPRVTVFFWHTDSSITGNQLYWPQVNLPRDNKRHNYSLSQRKADSTYTHLGGWLLNSDPKEGRWEKHALIENIILRKALKQ
jgi:hypothetical protein